MKKLIEDWLFFVVALLIVCGAIYYEVSLWNECRSTNSFWYCARVLGK